MNWYIVAFLVFILPSIGLIASADVSTKTEEKTWSIFHPLSTKASVVVYKPIMSSGSTLYRSKKTRRSVETKNNQKMMKNYLKKLLKTLNVSSKCISSQCSIRDLSGGNTTEFNANGSFPVNITIFACGKTLHVQTGSECHFNGRESNVSTTANDCDLAKRLQTKLIQLWNNNASCSHILRIYDQRKPPINGIKSTGIDKAFENTLSNEIKSICTEFNPKNCLCNFFEVTYQNMSINLCSAELLPPGDIVFNSTKLKSSWIPNVQQKTCNHFNLTNAACQCKNIYLKYQSKKRNICTEIIGEKNKQFIIRSLQELCKIFGTDPQNCTCEKFQFKDLSSFCEFERKINTSRTMVIYEKRFVLPYAYVGTLSAVVGIIGNSVVIAMSLKFRKTLSTCKKLFAHLAASDLTFAILQLVYFIPKFWDSRWIYGENMCKLLKGTEKLGAMVAVGIILIISIERYIGILEPFQRGISKHGLIWVLSINALLAVASVVPLFHYNTIDRAQLCRTVWPDLQRHNKIYNLYLFILYFLIPVVIVSILYARIVINLRGTVIFGNSNWIADPRLRKKRVVDNRRTMYVLWAVVVAFVVLVLPMHLVNIYFDFAGLNDVIVPKEKLSKNTYFSLLYLSLFPYPLHVAINPFIYCLIDSKWRSDMVHLLLQIPKRARAYSTTLTTSVLRRRSSTIRRRSSSGMVLETPEEVRMPKFSASNCLKISDAEITPGVTPEVTPRKIHYSDSSTKSYMSEYSFDTDSPDPFAP